MGQEPEQTRAGEIAILLTADEAAALESAIRECTGNTGASYVKALKAIDYKLQQAKGKML
jgi:hypothetical protein